jgi:hypothetical protein
MGARHSRGLATVSPTTSGTQILGLALVVGFCLGLPLAGNTLGLGLGRTRLGLDVGTSLVDGGAKNKPRVQGMRVEESTQRSQL